MTAEDVTSFDSGPPATRPPSRLRRFFTWWPLWALGLLAAIAGIIAAIVLPLDQRAKAMRRFEAERRIDYLRLEPEWMYKQFDWSPGLRDVYRLKCGTADDATLHGISLLHEVRKLWLEGRGSPFTEQGLSVLERLPQLTELRLFGESYTDEVLVRILASRPPLKMLVLEHTGAGHETLLALSQIPTIEALYIVSDSLDDEDYRDLETLPNLRCVDIDGIGDIGAEWIARSRAVECVKLHRASVTEEGVRQLCSPSLFNLKELQMWGIALTSTSLRMVVDRKLEYCQVDLRDVSFLSPNDLANLPDTAGQNIEFIRTDWQEQLRLEYRLPRW
jgi:hypothetical protein